jgi:tetratricopeptide (TPR) repeat protein
MQNEQCRMHIYSALCILHCALLMAACGPSREPQPAGEPKLPQVTLPDLTRMSPAVQAQLREADAALRSKTTSSNPSPADVAIAYGELGNLLLAAEYLDAAEACYLNAAALAPENMRWPYYLGHVYRTRGEPAAAAKAFERALVLGPNYGATLVWLGQVYLDLGEPDRATEAFAQAVTREPRSVAALSGQGRALLAKRDFGHAAKTLEQALAIDSRATMIHYPLALAYRGLGEQDKAEAHLRLRGTVEVAPNDPLMQELGTLLNSAVAYEKRGLRALDGRDWAGAATQFRKAIELTPGNGDLHQRLGTALSLNGDLAGAMDEFREAIQRSPESPQAHFSLGVTLASSGRFAEAVGQFSAAVRYDPSYANARLQLAVVLMRVGRAQEARAQLLEGARRNPDRPEFARALEQMRAPGPR